MENTHRGLVKFLLAHLKNNARAEAVLGRNYSRRAAAFTRVAQKEFTLSEKTIGYKEQSEDGGERRLATIYRLRAKKHA